jgi:tetratricopeptide (TPR) repeat protein
MEAARDLLEAYETAPTYTEAEHALDALAGKPALNIALGDLYDELAEMAAEDGDFTVAVRVQRKALEHGCEYPELAREMLAWYLLKGGERKAGEALLAEMREERPDDADLLILIGNARWDAGPKESALAAFDEALAMAKRQGDRALIAQARGERRYCRQELGMEPDEDDAAAPDPLLETDETVQWSVGWFPRDQRDAALERWPDLAEDLADPDAYCRSIERVLRALHSSAMRRPVVAPLMVDEFVAFARSERLDPQLGSTRSRYATQIARAGGGLTWPPGRNDPCWCRSGRKYKRCCAAD